MLPFSNTSVFHSCPVCVCSGDHRQQMQRYFYKMNIAILCMETTRPNEFLTNKLEDITLFSKVDN